VEEDERRAVGAVDRVVEYHRPGVETFLA